MRLPSLDPRLSCAAALFPACAYGADIGADHGRLSCYLLANAKCERMCVTDISEDSLNKARRLMELHRLSHRADFCVGDGLKALKKPVQAAAILGMGGHTLSGILKEGKDHLMGASLILSAHTQIPLVRETLENLQYHLEEERIVLSGGRYYIVMLAKPGMEHLNEKQRLIGPRLMEKGGDNYPEYLSWRMDVTACEQTNDAVRRLKWLKEEWDHACHGTDR